MGASRSKAKADNHLKTDKKDKPEPVSPHTSEVFDKEWREENWTTKDQKENKLREFQICNPKVSHINIMLVGPVGAGKSSFINSVNNVFEHRITVRAAAANQDISCTKQFKGYNIKGQHSKLPFMIIDVMGLQDDDLRGIHCNDVINALLGHVKENHVFNPISPLAPGDANYIRKPRLNAKAHCLVNIVSANSISRMNDSVIEKMTCIRRKANDKGIPQVVIMTFIDECCTLVQQNLRNVYKSKTIKDKMKKCSNVLGVPMNCIFPLKNYSDEIQTNNDTDVLILTALTQMINFANDYVEDL